MLNRIDRASFSASFEEHQAVQYFYEPFLEAYDPELRKELGVWYTPREIVRYMVERVDRVLREELHVANGLAAKEVLVLDPCCGTGAYLVEVLRKIAETARANSGVAIAALEAKKAALERVFGFEIMPSPFVIAHLQIGMVLHELGASLADENERPAVYLTNALTGWEPPRGPKRQLKIVFQEFVQEQQAATRVKKDKPILVVLGNPPYNAFAGVSTDLEGHLADIYKEGLISEWGIKKFNLDDLYVRFFRLAERRIAEQTRRGVICFISNFSYLDNRETGKLTPDGKPDPSVFSTEYNREGIRVGTAIALLARKENHLAAGGAFFRQFWGSTKRADLLESLKEREYTGYTAASPCPENRYSFKPSAVAASYLEWPRATDLCAEPPSNGLMEKRGGALIDTNRSQLEKRMRAYFNPKFSWEEYRETGFGLVQNHAGFAPEKARQKALEKEVYDGSRIVRYALRPFDTQWAYYTAVNPIWNRARPQLWAQFWQGNRFIVTRFKAAKEPEGPPWYFTTALSDDHLLSPDAVAIPILLKRGQEGKKVTVPNLSGAAHAYLDKIGLGSAEFDGGAPLWMHTLAIGYASAYLEENADGVRRDWPRFPLPGSKELLLKSATLGRELAGLLNVETDVAGVTAGAIRPELRLVAVLAREGGGVPRESRGEMDVTMGWGHFGKERAVMPGSGRTVERDYSAAEMEAIASGGKALGIDGRAVLRCIGEHTSDVYLNKAAFFKNIPDRVWKYTIGGYQVIKKWLSYRDKRVLRRGLVVEEIEEVTAMARRIAAILLMQPELDANYREVKASAYKWPPN